MAGSPLEETVVLDEPAFRPFAPSRVLGEGGSGTVYEVQRDGRALALKVLRAELALSARERQRFLDEAARMRRIEHRAIVRLVDSGILDDGRPFIAMPLLVGETLAVRLDRGRLELATALGYFADIAEAVAAVHAAGLIHRDIKPENILVCASDGGAERPILLDLGIARDADASPSTTTEQGCVRGTRAYMAPERFFDAPASKSTDIYELAVVLYMMLVGEPPWADGDGASSRLHPRDPADLGVAIPEALRTTLLRALSTRPELRPASVEAFATAVRDCHEAPAKVTPRRDRRPFVVTAVFGVLLAGVGASYLARGPSNRAASGDASLSRAPSVAAELDVPSAAVEAPALPIASTARLPLEASAARSAAPPGRRQLAKPSASASAKQAEAPVTEPLPSATATSADRLYQDRK